MRPRARGRARVGFVSIFKFTAVLLLSFVASATFAATQWEPAERHVRSGQDSADLRPDSGCTSGAIRERPRIAPLKEEQ